MLLHPAIAEAGFGALGASTSCPAADDDLPAPAQMCAELLQRFAEVSDGRRDQGRVHPVAVVLALCAAAVVAGMRSFTAIAGWAADVSAELLAQLYDRGSESPSTAPSKATIWRVVTGADAAAVDAVIGTWLAHQSAARQPGAGQPGGDSSLLVTIAVDGKTVRGATDAEGNQVHLLAAATHHDGLVLGQVEVGAKTNEVRREAPCRSPNSVRRNSEDSSWVQWLTRSRKVMGTRACHEFGGHVQMPGVTRRGTCVIWRKLDCLNRNLQ
ncbi:MAG: transposase family protein [Pseudonocardiaceae bacterium]